MAASQTKIYAPFRPEAEVKPQVWNVLTNVVERPGVNPTRQLAVTSSACFNFN
jgi:hypothetical protein